MFCTRCGAPNDDNAHRCVSCNDVLFRPDDPAAAQAPTYLAGAIIVTVLCCMPPGVVAIVYAAMALSANNAGRYDMAHQYSRNARIWTWVGFGLGLAWLVPYAIFLIIGIIAAQQANGP